MANDGQCINGHLWTFMDILWTPMTHFYFSTVYIESTPINGNHPINAT